MNLVLRPARPNDVDVIIDFNARLAWETEQKRLDPATLRAGVRTMLDDSTKGRYFVAERDGVVVGQLGITLEWSDWRNGDFWWIQSVYVAADARRQGVFRRLYEHVIAAAQADGRVIGVRLYVERDNHAAQAVYRSLGLHETHYLLLEQSPL
jgi:ribosomal protein S18 acetylase RimI-like enzyme